MKKLLLLFFLGLFCSSASQLFGQNKHFQGTWTKVGTTYVFEFDLHLEHSKDNQVTGFFKWQVTGMDDKSKFSQDHYDSRLGTTAKEFVKGTFNPATKTYKLSGYKKEDPNLIISLDHYILKIDEKGDIGGNTRAHGTWKGRINGKPVISDQVF